MRPRIVYILYLQVCQTFKDTTFRRACSYVHAPRARPRPFVAIFYPNRYSSSAKTDRQSITRHGVKSNIPPKRTDPRSFSVDTLSSLSFPRAICSHRPITYLRVEWLSGAQHPGLIVKSAKRRVAV